MIKKSPSQRTPIHAGQWVLARVNAGLCGYPRLVTRDSDSTRVFFRRPDADNPDKEEFMMRDSIAYVCDSRSEAYGLYDLSKSRDAEMAKAQKNVADIFKLRVESILSIDADATSDAGNELKHGLFAKFRLSNAEYRAVADELRIFCDQQVNAFLAKGQIEEAYAFAQEIPDSVARAFAIDTIENSVAK